jgi:hypothetical protein
MGTSARVIFKSEGQIVFNMRAHYDGYPDGVGLDLARIILEGKLVDGLGQNRTLGAYFNGDSCMAASVIALMKKEPGNIYLYPTSYDFDANYKYIINVTKKDTIEFRMTGGRSFEGTLEEFIEEFGTKEDKEKFLQTNNV